MQLYVCDHDGTYHIASQETVLASAKQIFAEKFKRGTQIQDSRSAGETIKGLLAGYDHEVFGVLFVDNKYRVIEWRELSHGTINLAVVNPRTVAQEALRLNAAAVILAHNHPSGDSTPSSNDGTLTSRIKEALGLFDIGVLDHIIVGENITSMSEIGLM